MFRRSIRRPHRRPALGAPVLVALAALPLAAAADEPAAPAPRVEVVQETIDVGVVAQGDRVQAVFEVRNKGGAELAILSAKPS